MYAKASIFLFLGLIMLVPASLLVASPAAQASSSSPSPASIFIIGEDGTPKSMELKATNENGQIKKASGFTLAADNVLSVDLNDKLTVFSNGPISFTGAKIAISSNPETRTDLQVTAAGEIFLTSFPAGVYILDVIVDGKYAYECLVVIGQVTDNKVINKEITEINKRIDIDIKKSFEKGKQKQTLDREKVCRFTPGHPICKPIHGDDCGKGFAMNEDGNCFPTGKCPSGYHRANDDETGACISEDNLEKCKDGSWKHPGDMCYGEDLTPTPAPSPVVSCSDEPENPECVTPEPQMTEDLSSNCGGVPCSPSDKEDSWLSDGPEKSPGVPADPEPDTPEPEPEEDKEEEPEASDTTADKDADTDADESG